MIRYRLLLSSLLLVSSACISSDKNVKSSKSKDDKCNQVVGLIAEHKTGFKELRNKLKNHKYADIWSAKRNLVGKDCQILRWNNNKYSYTCNVLSPSENTAMQRYQDAKSRIESCLGDGWALEERTAHGRKGKVAIYASKTDKTVVATHIFETSGIFRKEWTNYIFIGDRKTLK